MEDMERDDRFRLKKVTDRKKKIRLKKLEELKAKISAAEGPRPSVLKLQNAIGSETRKIENKGESKIKIKAKKFSAEIAKMKATDVSIKEEAEVEDIMEKKEKVPDTLATNKDSRSKEAKMPDAAAEMTTDDVIVFKLPEDVTDAKDIFIPPRFQKPLPFITEIEELEDQSIVDSNTKDNIITEETKAYVKSVESLAGMTNKKADEVTGEMLETGEFLESSMGGNLKRSNHSATLPPRINTASYESEVASSLGLTIDISQGRLINKSAQRNVSKQSYFRNERLKMYYDEIQKSKQSNLGSGQNKTVNKEENMTETDKTTDNNKKHDLKMVSIEEQPLKVQDESLKLGDQDKLHKDKTDKIVDENEIKGPDTEGNTASNSKDTETGNRARLRTDDRRRDSKTDSKSDSKTRTKHMKQD